jgi:hypothetical protein
LQQRWIGFYDDIDEGRQELVGAGIRIAAFAERVKNLFRTSHQTLELFLDLLVHIEFSEFGHRIIQQFLNLKVFVF